MWLYVDNMVPITFWGALPCGPLHKCSVTDRPYNTNKVFEYMKEL